jgi:hypothetical protein
VENSGGTIDLDLLMIFDIWDICGFFLGGNVDLLMICTYIYNYIYNYIYI